jgi:hypothetical protein
MLSAIGSGIFVLLVTIVKYGTCTLVTTTSFICQIDNWTGWQQVFIVGPIWLVFFIGWFPCYIFGFGPLEVSKAGGPFIRFLRSMTQFTPIHTLLFTYAGIAIFCIVVFWWRSLSQSVAYAVAYALACIIAFVATCCLFYRTPPDRRRYLIGGYVILAVLGAIVMFLVGPMNYTILGTACLIVLVGGWTFFRRRPQSAGTPPSLATVQAQTISPQAVFLSLFSGLGRGQTTPPPSGTGPGQTP